MQVRVAQLRVTEDIRENIAKIISVLDDAKANEWVVFPEGMLSGYFPQQDDFIDRLNPVEINRAIDTISALAEKRNLHCLLGTAYFESGGWFNAGLYLGSAGQRFVYRKVNLATLDHRHFRPGDQLEPFSTGSMVAGIQACRDISFPEQWKVLKRKGARLVFHLNNALKPQDEVWQHLLIARAFENQFFVVSVNNAAFPQVLPSLVISPAGAVLYRSSAQTEQIESVAIDLDKTRTDYLQQERRDVVDLRFA